jgi:8-amino-7-oxononanoate synthase
VLDFTSSLYLGLTHGTHELPGWRRLTTGTPAVIREPAIAGRVSEALARLIGTEDAVLSPSTLHAFWDAVGDVCGSYGEPAVVLVDAGTYPIARWALARATARGVTVATFAHHDVRRLAKAVDADAGSGRRPIVVADGLCPGCGVAPLRDYASLVAGRGGAVLIDDTQALGILGRDPHAHDVYGLGGGGSLRWTGAPAADFIVVASLAKGFGAPLAVTASSAHVVRRLAESGETRVHSSPPSQPHLLAAERAMIWNRANGDATRRRLARKVELLRGGLDELGLAATTDLFPIQGAGPFTLSAARRVHSSLHRRGVATVLQQPRCGRGALVSFVVTAAHRVSDIERALGALRGAITDAQHKGVSHAS